MLALGEGAMQKAQIREMWQPRRSVQSRCAAVRDGGHAVAQCGRWKIIPVTKGGYKL